MSAKPSQATGLLYIAAFKLIKGLLLLALAVGALRFLHHDVAATAAHCINKLRVDPENLFVHRLLASLSIFDDHKLKELSIGTFLYSGLSLTEGIGLALRKRWAEYFTTIITASFIPLEIWEIHLHVSETRVVLLVINLSVVVYLIWELSRSRARHHAKSKESGS
jgi:uncharacterized membrane protein (DUF2068 family)